MADKRTIPQLLDDINARLDNVEDLMAWLIRAGSRFKKGQRVKFSPAAYRKGVASRRKGGASKGKVVDVDEDGFSVKVLLDGYAKPRSFHHGFFDPASKR